MRSGWLATFRHPEHLEHAVAGLRRKGVLDLDPLSPFALATLEELAPRARDASWVGRLFPRVNVAGTVTLAAALGGMLTAFGTQWLAHSWAAPYDAGGRPLFSWPAYVPITFVFSVLAAGVTLFLSTFWLLRLPEPWHPFFDVPEFRFDEDRFYLFVPHAQHPRDTLRRLLEDLGADTIHEVAA